MRNDFFVVCIHLKNEMHCGSFAMRASGKRILNHLCVCVLLERMVSKTQRLNIINLMHSTVLLLARSLCIVKTVIFFIVYFSILTIWPHLPSWHTFHSIIIILFFKANKDQGQRFIYTIHRSIDVSLPLLLRFCHTAIVFCGEIWGMRYWVFFLIFILLSCHCREYYPMMEKNNIAQLCSMFDWTSHKPCSSFCSTINTFVT